uniref:Uncharacterized protein n=1 Tax=Anopheles atroparvus TaxID=41427 RepID=A0A182JHA0_ANOAO
MDAVVEMLLLPPPLPPLSLPSLVVPAIELDAVFSVDVLVVVVVVVAVVGFGRDSQISAQYPFASAHVVYHEHYGTFRFRSPLFRLTHPNAPQGELSSPSHSQTNAPQRFLVELHNSATHDGCTKPNSHNNGLSRGEQRS